MYWIKLARIDDKSVRITCRDLPSIDLVYVYDKTSHNLRRTISNSVTGALSIIISGGGSIPTPTSSKAGEIFIPLSKRTQLCVSIYETIIENHSRMQNKKNFIIPPNISIYEFLDPLSKENQKVTEGELDRFLSITIEEILHQEIQM